MKSALRFLAAALITVALPAMADAQSASILATAQVQQQLTVAKDQDLTLGNAFPGTTRTVLPTDAASGAFQLTGAPNAEITVNLTLPTNLVSGGNNLPITFGASSAAWNLTNSRAGTTAFNPVSTLTRRVDATTGKLWVFIGGSVSPTTQPAGLYTGTITLNAAYTGN